MKQHTQQVGLRRPGEEQGTHSLMGQHSSGSSRCPSRRGKLPETGGLLGWGVLAISVTGCAQVWWWRHGAVAMDILTLHLSCKSQLPSTAGTWPGLLVSYMVGNPLRRTSSAVLLSHALDAWCTQSITGKKLMPLCDIYHVREGALGFPCVCERGRGGLGLGLWRGAIRRGRPFV